VKLQATPPPTSGCSGRAQAWLFSGVVGSSPSSVLTWLLRRSPHAAERDCRRDRWRRPESTGEQNALTEAGVDSVYECFRRPPPDWRTCPKSSHQARQFARSGAVALSAMRSLRALATSERSGHSSADSCRGLSAEAPGFSVLAARPPPAAKGHVPPRPRAGLFGFRRALQSKQARHPSAWNVFRLQCAERGT
jgi:hypothetical protein